MAEPIDVAYVEIRPDFRGFRAETERGIRRELGQADAGVDLEPNVRGFAAETERKVGRALTGARAEIGVQPNVSSFRRTTERAVSTALTGASADVSVHPLLRNFRADLATGVDRALIGEHADVDIDPDLRGFRAETQRAVDRELAGVSGNVAVGASQAAGGGAAANAAAGAAGAKAATKDVTALGKASEVTKGQVSNLTGSMALLGGSTARLATIGTAGGIVAIGASAGIAAVKVEQANASFESAFAGVRKTVDATDAELESLKKGFIDLSTQIPISATDLAGLGEAAGALGVKTSAIIEFTDTVAKIASVSDLSADAAANALARIANITQLPQTQFSNLGSAIVKLGLSSAATEPEIADFSLRIAGAGKQIGLSIGEITGFGAALASVGIDAEAGGTAISTTFIKIAAAVDAGGKKLQSFADVAGKSSSEFAQEFKEKPAEAILAFIEGLARVKTEGGSVFSTLDKLGLGGIRVRDALLRASGAGGLFADAIKTGNTAFAENDALNKAAAARFDTTAAKIQLAKNEVTALELSMGGLNRALGDAAGGFGSLVHDLRTSEDAATVVRNVIDDLKALIGPFVLAFQGTGPEIRDAFGDAARIFSSVLVAAKPLLLVTGIQLAAAVRIGVKALTVMFDILDKIAGAFRTAEGIVVAAVDKFLGAFSELASVANKALPGNPFGGVEDAINTAREHLRAFGTDLDEIGGKTVTATVKVDLQLPSAAFIESQISGVAATATAAAASGATKAAATGAGKTAAAAAKTGKTPAFGEPGFKPLPSGPDPTKGFSDPNAEVPKAIAARNQRLQDEVQLAKTRNETTADDKKALADLAAFSRKQADNILLSVQIRRQFLIQAQAAEQEIRQIQAQEAAAAKQARTDEKNAADQRAKDAKADADAKIAARESVLQSNLSIARTTEQTAADDRAALVALKNFYAGRVKILGERTAAGRTALANEKAASAEIKKLDEEQAKARAEARQKKSEERLSAFEDAVTLAKLTRNDKSDDVRALEAERRELARQIAALAKNDPLRRKLKIQWQEVTNDLEDIAAAKKQAGDADKKAFAKTSFEFLQAQQGFTANLLSNLIPGGASRGLVSAGEASPTGAPTPRPDRPSDVGAGVSGPRADLSLAQAQGDSRNGLTQGQANQLLSLTRQMLDALHDIKQAGKFPEAGTARVRTRHAQEGVF